MGEYEPNDSRKVDRQQPGEAGKRPGWRQAEAGEPKEPYEPTDSRHVTAGQEAAAGAPGEGDWRRQEAAEAALDETEGEQAADPQAEQALREASMEQDAEELQEAAREDRND